MSDENDVVALVRGKFTELDTFMGDMRRDFTGLSSRIDQVRQQALARGPGGSVPPLHGAQAESLGAIVVQSEAVKQLMTGSRTSARVEIPGRVVAKAIITLSPTLQPGVQSAPIAPLPREPLGVLDLIPQIQLTQGSLQVVRQSAKAAPGAAVQLNQGDVKAEQTLTFTTATVNPQTLAAWIPLSRQAAQDVPSLMTVVEFELLTAVKELEENQVLNGLSTLTTPVDGELTGLNTNAPAVTSTSTTTLDAIADLIGALIARGVQPTGLVVHPSDALGLAKLKTLNGEYLLGSPSAAPGNVLWSVALAVSSKQPAGTVLAGNFLRGARLWYREDATIEISSEHADFFTRNLLAARCEERLLLEITQANYFGKVVLPAPEVEAAAAPIVTQPERKK